MRSAGMFVDEDLVNRKWQRAEDDLAEGRVGDLARGRMRVRRYVEDPWLSHHVRK